VKHFRRLGHLDVRSGSCTPNHATHHQTPFSQLPSVNQHKCCASLSACLMSSTRSNQYIESFSAIHHRTNHAPRPLLPHADVSENHMEPLTTSPHRTTLPHTGMTTAPRTSQREKGGKTRENPSQNSPQTKRTHARRRPTLQMPDRVPHNVFAWGERTDDRELVFRDLLSARTNIPPPPDCTKINTWEKHYCW
jgi:hypothetical protein